MQFLTAKTVLYIRVAVLSVIAFLMMKLPQLVAASGAVVLMGQAMQVPIIKVDGKNDLTGMVLLLLGILVLSDVIPLLADNIEYFATVVPTRLSLYFVLSAYIYFFPSPSLGNNLVLTFAFLEIWLNFLAFNNLRDEKYNRMVQFIKENADKIQEAQNERPRVVEIE